ncbi:DUF2087 domain-containing protein [Clostridium sp. YIM B02505]|uniref:DUF2087 domain-containing protein n=1 Tax=Clostridium yunnanense TaxID=2800325 RepID=A0ABS1EI77_9CLOT|nr:DUF2087 domain-containing protein [Clostridium yunnanense]MBK1809069.1 DUF2087 domain-containing protein [Clostridium yunnanense]
MEKDYLFDYELEEIEKGYFYDHRKKHFKCLICGSIFEQGRIYKINEEFYDAEKCCEKHIEEAHGDMFDFLIERNKKITGLSETVKDFIKLTYQGLSDKEIGANMGVSLSTVRSYRFKLKEKELQAKSLLAILGLMKNNSKEDEEMDGSKLVNAHLSATTLDERYNISEQERNDIRKNYFDENGALKVFPSKEKKKLAILSEIITNFSRGNKYTEKEVNRVLMRIFDDYATLRRYLIEYGFLDRTKDCMYYWVKE